jgi:serine/threonine protein kinase
MVKTVLENKGERHMETTLESVNLGSSNQSDSSDFSGLQIAGISSIKRLEDSSGKKVESGEAELFEGVWQGQRVVIKWFSFGKRPKPGLIKKIAELDRKCVVEILETGICNDRDYEILEFIEHGSLRDWVKNRKEAQSSPDSIAQEVLRELTSAIEALHQINIIHRDIKPDNILVRKQNPLDLVLTDFGISSLAEVALHQTSAFRTAEYSAPEAMTGVVCKASDWWSVGMVILELLTGRVVFEGMDERGINLIVATKGIEIPETLPERWQNLLAGLLCQNYSERWGTDQVRDWLEGKEPPSPASNRRKSIAAEGGEPKASKPYAFKDGKYLTPATLADALVKSWDHGLKHYGRRRILDWLENDLSDSEKVVQFSDLTDNKKLTPEMKFAVVLLILNPKMPFSWRGELIDATFAHTNGELLWSMVEAGMVEMLGSMGISNDALAMVEVRQKAYLESIAEHKTKYDLEIAKKIIGAPEERIFAGAVETAESNYRSLEKNNELPACVEGFPDFKDWFSVNSLGLAGCLALNSCIPTERNELFLPVLERKALEWSLAQTRKAWFGNKPLIAIPLAAIFGPIGLLYISWKLSVVTLLLHIIVCAILGWPKLAVITFWHIVPFFIAYWVTRNVTSLSSLSRRLGTDSIASYVVIREISLSPVGASASTVLFLTGFIFVGCIAFSNWLQLIFAFFLCVYASILTFDISRKYIEANKTGTTASYPYRFLPNSEALKRWLFWAACTLLFVLTFKLWNQPPGLTTGLMRLFLTGATIGLPFAPVFRGAIGAVGLGIIGGIASLIVAAIPAGIISYLFGIFTK